MDQQSTHADGSLAPDSALAARDLSPEEFRAAFRNHAAGVAIVTADPGDGPVGMTATSVFSVSATPPLLVFSVSELSSATPGILAADSVVVHLLGADQTELAKRFATSGIDVGLFCATPSVTLSRNVGRKAAFEMLVTGDFIDAETARRRGLVNRVAAPDALDAEVEALLARILDKPRVALELGKALFYRQLEAGLPDALADASRTMACNMAHETALEGVQAFIDKRPPAWRG